jgi:Uma2 family endonuclease
MSTVLDRMIPPGVRPRLVTVAEYERMIAAGIYTENDRLELLAGEVVEFTPKGPKRVYCNEFIADFCKAKLGARADVRSQNPIVVGDFSEPEPDIVLAQPPRERYLERHPTPADIFLVMEISDSTLAYDREAKALVYARGGIPRNIYCLICKIARLRITANPMPTATASNAPCAPATR